MAKRVDELLRSAWRARYPRRTRPAWATGLYNDHIPLHLMKAVAGDQVQDLSRASLQALLDDDGWATLAELGGLAAEYARAATEDFESMPVERRPTVTAQRISEKACDDVATAFQAAQGKTSRLADILGPARDAFVAEQRTRLRVLASRDFAALVGDELVRRWAAIDRASPDWRSPADLDLGSNRRPPVVGKASWPVGSDRSVYARYVHLRSPNTARRLPAAAAEMRLPAERHMTLRLRGADPAEAALGEVARTCEPLGLAHPEHRALLETLRRALAFSDLEGYVRGRPYTGPRPGDGLLVDWAERPEPLSTRLDTDLAEAIREQAEGWAARSGLAHVLADRVRRSDGLGWDSLTEVGAVRRLWLHALNVEQEWAAPLSRSAVPRVVRSMLSKHLQELLKPPALALLRADPEFLDRRRTATATLLSAELATGELGDALRNHSSGLPPDLGPRYERALGNHAPAGRLHEYLTAAQFMDWLAEFLHRDPVVPEDGEAPGLDDGEEA